MLKPYREGDEPVPGYRLVAYLGRGAFGQVWRAVSAGGGIEVALKVIDSLDPKQGGKELRALRLLKRIRHPNLVPLIAYWLKDEDGQLIQDDGSAGELSAATDTLALANLSRRPVQLLVAMGLGEKSLFDRFEECQREGLSGIPADELLRYMDGAAKAIDSLNTKHGIQHCDIKPQNILIVGGEAQVCDFGLAKALNAARQSSATAGTMAYSAPEIFTPRGASPSTDQYCLAISYYELRTGSLPFDSDEIHRVLDAKRSGDLNLSRVGPAERDVLLQATAVDPDARFSSTEEFTRQLRDALDESGVEFKSASGVKIKRRTSQSLYQSPQSSTAVWVQRAVWLTILAGIVGAGGWGLTESGRRVIGEWFGGSPHVPASAEFATCLKERRYGDAAALVTTFPEEEREKLRAQLAQVWGASLTQLMDEQQVAKAMQTCRELVDRLPDAPESAAGLRLLIEAGETAFQRDDVNGARELFNTVLDLSRNHPQTAGELLSSADLGLKLADVRQSGVQSAADWLPAFVAGREDRSEWQRANLVLLDALSKPADLPQALQGLLILKVKQPDLSAKLSDPWARGQLAELERKAMANVRDLIARDNVVEASDVVVLAKQVWPELTLVLDLNDVDQLRMGKNFGKARERLAKLRGPSLSKSGARLVAEHELRLDLADSSVPFSQFLERGGEVLAQSETPSQILRDMYQRLGKESAHDQVEALTLVCDYGRKIPVALNEAERNETSALCFRARFVEPTMDYESLRRAGRELRLAAINDPVVEILLAECELETKNGAAPEVSEALEPTAAELPDVFQSYLKYVRVLRAGMMDRKADAVAIAGLLSNQDLAWRTPHRVERLREFSGLAASQLRWPTDADVLQLQSAFPDLELARSSLPARGTASTDDNASQVRHVLTLLGVGQQRPLSREELDEGLPIAARLVEQHSNLLESGKQLLLVRLFLGQGAAQRFAITSDEQDRDTAIRSSVMVIRSLFRIQGPKPGVPDGDLFRRLAEPTYRFVASVAKEPLSAAVRPDAAFAAAAFGRIAQRTRVQVTADQIYDAYALAVRLDPQADYVVGQGRALCDTEKSGKDADKLKELGALLKSPPEGAGSAFTGLRGMLHLSQSRSVPARADRLAMLSQAMKDLDVAVEMPADERDEFYASYLGWQSTAYTEYANYYFRGLKLECEEVKDAPSQEQYLKKAVDLARRATEQLDRRRPEDGWNALGNALEDHAFLLRQFDQYQNAIDAFSEVRRIELPDARELGASYFHGGRCRYRWATTKISAENFALASPEERREQLEQSLKDLENAATVFRDANDRHYSEVCFWLAAASRELAKYLPEADRSAARAKADPYLAEAVKSARDAELPEWSRWQFERMQNALLQADRRQAESYYGELLEFARLEQPFDPTYVRSAAIILSDQDRSDPAAFAAQFGQLLKRHSDAVSVLSGHPLDRIEVELRAARDILRLYHEATYGKTKNDKQLAAQYLQLFTANQNRCEQLLAKGLAETESLAESERLNLQWQLLSQQGRLADYGGNFKDAIAKLEQAVTMAELGLSDSARKELQRIRNHEIASTDCRAVQQHLLDTWDIRFQMAGLCREYYGPGRPEEPEKPTYVKQAVWVARPLLAIKLDDIDTTKKQALARLEKEIQRLEKTPK